MLVFRPWIKVQHTKQKQWQQFTSLEVLNNRKEKQRQHFNSSEAYLGSGLPVVGLCQWKLFQPCHSLQRTVILIFCPTHHQLAHNSTWFADIQRGNLISGTVRYCLWSWPQNCVFLQFFQHFAQTACWSSVHFLTLLAVVGLLDHAQGVDIFTIVCACSCFSELNYTLM